jgi:hypothetical protein
MPLACATFESISFSYKPIVSDTSLTGQKQENPTQSFKNSINGFGKKNLSFSKFSNIHLATMMMQFLSPITPCTTM